MYDSLCCNWVQLVEMMKRAAIDLVEVRSGIAFKRGHEIVLCLFAAEVFQLKIDPQEPINIANIRLFVQQLGTDNCNEDTHISPALLLRCSLIVSIKSVVAAPFKMRLLAFAFSTWQLTKSFNSVWISSIVIRSLRV